MADRWIQSRLEATLSEVEAAYDSYRFDLASQSLYDFVWNEFCDWYLELSKPLLWDRDQQPPSNWPPAERLSRCSSNHCGCFIHLCPF